MLLLLLRGISCPIHWEAEIYKFQLLCFMSMIQLPTPPLVDFGAHTVNMDIPAKFVIEMDIYVQSFQFQKRTY